MSVQPWALVGLHAAVRFSVQADSSPGLLARLIQPFARRDLVPDSFTAERRGDAVRVEIVMTRMPAEMVHLVEGNLRQVVGVSTVATRQEVTGAARRQAA
jgi:acetolactate synthase small subunit